MKNQILISVIIPTYNNREMLKATLEALNWQTLNPDNFEVIVIDDGSSDRTDDMIKAFQSKYSIIYKFQKDKGRRVALARNTGIKLSKGEIIFFLDDTVIINTNVLDLHYRKHKQIENIYIQTCAIWNQEKIIDYEFIRQGYLEEYFGVIEDRNYIRNWIKTTLEDKDAHEKYTLGTNCASIKTEHLKKIGWFFDETFDFQWGDEDTDLGERLKKINVKQYWPFSVAYHNTHKRDNTESSCIINRLKLLRKHPHMLKYKIIGGGKNAFYNWDIEDIKRFINTYEKGKTFCIICKKEFPRITQKHLDLHNISMKDYINLGYPLSPIESEYKLKTYYNKRINSSIEKRIQVSFIIKNCTHEILDKIDKLDFEKEKIEVLCYEDNTLNIDQYNYLIKLISFDEKMENHTAPCSFVYIKIFHKKQLSSESLNRIMKKVNYSCMNYIGF